jgi:hypothetical protein
VSTAPELLTLSYEPAALAPERTKLVAAHAFFAYRREMRVGVGAPGESDDDDTIIIHFTDAPRCDLAVARPVQ